MPTRAASSSSNAEGQRGAAASKVPKSLVLPCGKAETSQLTSLHKLYTAAFIFLASVACAYLNPSLLALSREYGTTRPNVVGEDIEETGFSQSIQVSKLLLDTKSNYQRIQVYDSAKPYYGRVLVLDGVLQLAEGDAAAYNEMMAHMALFQHPHPRRVLVVGGGDGFVVSEVLKHKSVERVDHVDLDGKVIDVCKKYFPQWDKWQDSRVELHIDDGAAYCRKQAATGHEPYDVIIQDSSDPWTEDEGGLRETLPSSVLYTQEHLKNVYKLLDPEHGVFVFQAEMLQIPSDLEGVAEWRKSALEAGFARSRYGSIMIGSYPTGQIGFLMCERSASSASSQSIQKRFEEMETQYYHPGLQSAAFVLPLWAEKVIYKDDRDSQHIRIDQNATPTSISEACSVCKNASTSSPLPAVVLG